MRQNLTTSVFTLAMFVATWACGVEKGAKSKIIEEKKVTTEPIAPPIDNLETALEGLVAGKTFSILKAWIPIGTNVLYFTNEDVNGCTDTKATYLFSMSGFPDEVGALSAEQIAALSLTVGGETDVVTGFTGITSLTRHTATDIEGTMNIEIVDPADQYKLKGSFAAVRCVAETTADDGDGEDDTADGDDDEPVVEVFFTNWQTPCDTDTKTRFHMRLRDDGTFSITTYIYSDENCEAISMKSLRTGVLSLGTEILSNGDAMDFTYNTATMTMRATASVNDANTHAYADALSAVTGLCGLTGWVLDSPREVNQFIECFPYNTDIVHSNRVDELLYDVEGTKLKVSEIIDPIIETGIRSKVTTRGTTYKHTFELGSITD